MDSSSSELPQLAAQIVAAYLSKNPLPIDELPRIIREVYAALSNVGSAELPVADRPQPAVPIKRSITPDYLICLEDGKKLKMLKRHLRTAFDMTPEEYRERWDLPPDYPMVAPNYANQRSNLAKHIGLGTRARRRRTTA
jgi:predicted transcriptional regulator